jgi:hypothetical protein
MTTLIDNMQLMNDISGFWDTDDACNSTRATAVHHFGGTFPSMHALGLERQVQKASLGEEACATTQHYEAFCCYQAAFSE